MVIFQILEDIKLVQGRNGDAWIYSSFWCGGNPEDGDLLNDGDLQGRVTVPGLLIVPEMVIVLQNRTEQNIRLGLTASLLAVTVE